MPRLRSHHTRTRKTVGEQALITQLNQAIHDKSVKARSRFATTRWMAVRNGAQALQALFTRLESILDPNTEKAEILELLGEIVKEANELTKENDLSTALQHFSGNPSLKKFRRKYNFSSITSSIRKVPDRESSALVSVLVFCAISSSTYMEASTFLEHTAGFMRDGSYQTG